MPQLRQSRQTVEVVSPYFKKKTKEAKRVIQTFKALDEEIDLIKDFPLLPDDRLNVINAKTKRKITPFQFKVYDLCAQIPKGQVSTYKAISDALQSSPRAVGQALRTNPYAPLPVPCHRVISATFAIGGFDGGFGDCQLVADKKAKLTKEGCQFDEYTFVANADGTQAIFKDFRV
ncbi:6-O-methylguanine DNA methyltransferase [Syncephalastrum racemosum]|uniref:Methylated-DNA--protein-cysteine methyltransferase n=1 Tax=Syncephalastrum racemosum TaxID=13706 RepID=A0A1X2H6W5_SYNRA|nr:6-O-methylguanine DNA methyltransferase [Syncephalastrum racemosum]